MSQLTLSIVVHNRQPMGNFDHVFAEAKDTAYDPVLEALERHPGVRLALHDLGTLSDWLVATQPDRLERLANLVAREQVKLLTGAYDDPILVAVANADRLGQIHRMTGFLQRGLGAHPTGAGIAERVYRGTCTLL